MAETLVGEPVSVTAVDALNALDIFPQVTNKFITATAVLVDGLTLTTSLLSGTPSVPGTVKVIVETRDDYNRAKSGTYTLTVLPLPEPEPEPEPGPEPEPEPADLATAVVAFLGLQDNPTALALAREHVRVTTTFVRGYVRGRGFTDGVPNADLSDVIVSACARLVTNPQQATRQTLGGQSVGYASLNGFTLSEKGVLHNYRRRTA